jgi:hypothetical protein
MGLTKCRICYGPKIERQVFPRLSLYVIDTKNKYMEISCLKTSESLYSYDIGLDGLVPVTIPQKSAY